MMVLASLLVTATALLREVAHVNKANTSLPHNYVNDILVDQGCQDMKWLSMAANEGGGETFKKLGSGIKVTYFMRNRCEQYHSYQHTLDCSDSDVEMSWSNSGEFTVQSYKVESCF